MLGACWERAGTCWNGRDVLGACWDVLTHPLTEWHCLSVFGDVNAELAEQVLPTKMRMDADEHSIMQAQSLHCPAYLTNLLSKCIIITF